MAYLPGFDYDIFISYSHVDNLAIGEEVAWVQHFHEALEVSLARRVGRVGVVKIWRDQRLDGNQLFDITIKTAIEKSALFVALTSNGYVASEYCLQELNWFSKCAADNPFGIQIGDRHRICNVLLNNIHRDRWPSAFGRVSGYAFHDSTSDEELGFPLAPSDRDFLSRLRTFSDSLYETLVQLRRYCDNSNGKCAPSGESAAASGPLVVVADVSDTLRSTRKRIVQELTRKGVRVESGIPPPYSADEHDERVRRTMGSSSLSVHLLDQFPGREIDGGDGTTYSQRQVELAVRSGGAHFVWVPKALSLSEVEDDRHRAILDRLENGERGERSYEFIRGDPATLSPQILDKLKEITVAEEDRTEAKAVLLDTHIKDQLFAYQVGQYFLQNDIQPFINPQEDDPSKNLDILEARLRTVSMLMILFGQVSEQWVRQRLGAALQLSVVKGFRIKSFCVYSIPPDKGQTLTDFTIGPVQVQLIDNSRSDRFNPELFQPLLRNFTAGGSE